MNKRPPPKQPNPTILGTLQPGESMSVDLPIPLHYQKAFAEGRGEVRQSKAVEIAAGKYEAFVAIVVDGIEVGGFQVQYTQDVNWFYKLDYFLRTIARTIFRSKPR